MQMHLSCAILLALWTAFVAPVASFAEESGAEQIPGLAESIARVEQLQRMRDVDWPVAPPVAVDVAPEKTQPVLYGMARSQDPLIRQRAAEAWAALDTPEALEMLLTFLCDWDGETRAIAARRLSGWRADELFDAVARVLDGKDVLRAAGLDLALPELRPALETRMLELFANEEESVQRCASAAYCLGRMGARQAIPKLAQGARSGEKAFALACAQSLHMLHAADQAELWAELTLHGDMYMRGIALDALAQSGGAEALAALVRVASGETGERSSQLLQQAARGIAMYPFDDAVPAMIEVMRKNVKLRMFVYDLLQLRTGVDAGQTPSAWQEWFDALKGQTPVAGEGEKAGDGAVQGPGAVPGQDSPTPNVAQPAIQGFSVVE